MLMTLAATSIQISILAISIILGIFGASGAVLFLLYLMRPKAKSLPAMDAPYKGRY